MTAALRVAGWSLTIGALALLLVAPSANGPLLIVVWGFALAAFRYVVSIIAGRMPRVIIGAVFLWACFLGAFSGGWFLIPAGAVFLVYDWRTDARGVDSRLLRVELLTAAASAISGLVALALLVQTQPGARIPGPANVARDGTLIYEDLSNLSASGPPTDRLDLAVTIAGVLLVLLVLATVTHAVTSRRLAFFAMCMSVLGVIGFSAMASFSAGWWFLPAVALGITACFAAWRRSRLAGGRTSGTPGLLLTLL